MSKPILIAPVVSRTATSGQTVGLGITGAF